MAPPRRSRAQLLSAMADHVLACGMEGASLRPLARAAGTSDRMLIYHFGSKERLLVELVGHLGERYAAQLDTALAEGLPQGGVPPASRQGLLNAVLKAAQTPGLAPYGLLWWEIVAGAARERPGYREAAQRVAARIIALVEQRMSAADADPAGGARLLLALAQGAQMLGAIGLEDDARRALAAAPD